ncbi:peptidylprolyl isomerase [Undibacterium sp. FT137W]|uniref:peptidylprolyl isomerase n=2 Tax=Undibacterium fentianense TaxID=2828728 RepID=A0A941E3S2_9BURK|nr:peptidylprolyl isomerase [Undibacterium fentianense]
MHTYRSMGDILNQSKAEDWRALDPANTLYLETEKGRVVIELAPEFAPKNVANIRALVKEGYFDGLAMIRSHDNYVAQWGDPNEKREFKKAAKKVDGEFTVKFKSDASFTRLPDSDGYAPQVGHVNGFPVARDPKTQTTWLTHCYGAVGVARGNETDSGNGSSLYAVIGHAPRHLDRNITVVGRVMFGIELLASLPRGKAPLGFYETEEERTPIKSVRLAADVLESDRTKLVVFRTDTANFQALIEAQRNRGGEWYKFAANHIELCNVPIPVRLIP